MTNEQYAALEQEMETVLEKIFEAGEEVYAERGFKRRVGYGTRPAVIHIDIATACVRHTVENAVTVGFRPIVVKEPVGDRVPGVVAYNLFDNDSKFSDVEPLENVVNHLNELPNFEDTVPTTALSAKVR